MPCQECEYHKQRAALWRHEAYRLGGTPLPWNPDEVIQKAKSVRAYCHMDKMCLGCSPQLIEGICPDSRAGRLFDEMLTVLQEVVADHDAVNRLSWIDQSSSVIAKVRGQQ
jgi:hypothetical protein